MGYWDSPEPPEPRWPGHPPMSIRVSREDRQHIKEQARAAGLTVSEYIRRCALGRPIVAKTDLIIINELRRLGDLIKQISRQGTLSSEQGRTILDELVAAVRRVGRE